MHATLDDKLHPAWLAELRSAWQKFNEQHLASRLQAPVLQIDGGERRLGRWDSDARLLGIAHHHIWHHAWDEVLATLKHEMAHQYVDEVLGGDERPHGPQFARACAMLGIEAHASGTPRAREVDEQSKTLRRVQKLLALATSANRHEAEAAMAAANTLLLRYNLELPTGGPALGYAARRLGGSAAALPLDWKLVGAILAEFFFVECIWTSTYNARRDRSERVLEVAGSEANLEMAGYVHDFLHASVERLWQHEHKRLSLPATRKREYTAGVLLGFRDKLRQERRKNAEVGLVWLGDADLQRFFRDRHPRSGRWPSPVCAAATPTRPAAPRASGSRCSARCTTSRPPAGAPSPGHVSRAGSPGISRAAVPLASSRDAAPIDERPGGRACIPTRLCRSGRDRVAAAIDRQCVAQIREPRR